MSFYFFFHSIKFKKLFILFSPLLVYVIWVFLLSYFDIQSSMDNDKIWKNEIAIFGGLIAVICSEIIQPFMVIRYVLIYMKNKSLFLIFYLFFFIFYLLFIIFHFLFIISVHHLTSEVAVTNMYILDIVSFIFLVVFILYYVFQVEKEILRYLFAFLTVLCHICIKFIYFFYLTNDITYLKFQTNPIEFSSGFYFITLVFALIQLSIEVYYYYQKEKPKWQRFERMQKYKQSKN